MKAKVSVAIAVATFAGIAVAAPAPTTKGPPASAVKRVADFMKTLKPVDPRTKPTAKPIRIPGNGNPVCGIVVATGLPGCDPGFMQCPRTIVWGAIVDGKQVSYNCDVDCHGQGFADEDGKCECDVKFDTCKPM